jgi:hypothetical protein
MVQWQMTIDRTDNGYVLTFPTEVSSNGHSFLKRIVVEDNHDDDLASHEDLLYQVMEYFMFLGSKKKATRLIVVRQTKGIDY